MKMLFQSALAVLISLSGLSQTGKKPNFRLLAGPVYISKTNPLNFSYGSNYYSGYSRHEKGTIGVSVQALVSFYLAKKWRLNSGLAFDTKGFAAKGTGIGAAEVPVPYDYKVTGGYLGLPLSLEAKIIAQQKFELSMDAGLMEQWKIFSSKNGQELSKNQLSVSTGFYMKFPALSSKLMLHPMFRYGINPLQNPLIGGPSPNYNAYSFGLEIGYRF